MTQRDVLSEDEILVQRAERKVWGRAFLTLRLKEENERLKGVVAELVEAGALTRNVIIWDEHGFRGEWIAIPREDFDKLRMAGIKATSQNKPT